MCRRKEGSAFRQALYLPPAAELAARNRTGPAAAAFSASAAPPPGGGQLYLLGSGSSGNFPEHLVFPEIVKRKRVQVKICIMESFLAFKPLDFCKAVADRTIQLKNRNLPAAINLIEQ